MAKLQFPKPFEHTHAPVVNINEIVEKDMTFGQRAADTVARVAGSWGFIITQSLILIGWAIVNAVAWVAHWDPYPFILLNLFLSLQAAYTAPIIMMSQNRQAIRDRIEAHHDYVINQKAEEEVRAVLNHLAAQDQALEELHGMLISLGARPTPNNLPPHESGNTR